VLPPEGWDSFHTDYLEVMEDFAVVSRLIAEGVDELDAGKIEQANDAMSDLIVKIYQLADSLEAQAGR